MDYNTVYTNDTYSGNEYTSFLEGNYIWIIIVLVVILMTVVGYIADKKKLIKKKKNKNQDSDNKVSENIKKVNEAMSSIDEKENKLEEIEIDSNPIAENAILDSNEDMIDNVLKEEVANDEMVKPNDLSVDDFTELESLDESPSEPSIEEEMVEKVSTSNELSKVLEDDEDNLTEIEYSDENIENNDDSTFSEEIPDKVDSSIDEMYELSDEDEIEESQNNDLSFLNDNQEEKNDENIVDIDIELPDIDSIKTDDSPDDFWKF